MFKIDRGTRKRAKFSAPDRNMLLLIIGAVIPRIVAVLYGGNIFDIPEMYYAGKVILEGFNPYTYNYPFYWATEKLPPIIFYVYASALLIGGDNIATIHFVPLIFDFGTLYYVYALGKKLWGKVGGKLLFVLYGYSPFVFSQLLLGQNDFIPIFFSTASIYYLINDKEQISAIFFGLAVASKYFPLLLGFPFIIYILHKNKYMFRASIKPALSVIIYALIAAFTFLTVCSPYILADPIPYINGIITNLSSSSTAMAYPSPFRILSEFKFTLAGFTFSYYTVFTAAVFIILSIFYYFRSNLYSEIKFFGALIVYMTVLAVLWSNLTPRNLFWPYVPIIIYFTNLFFRRYRKKMEKIYGYAEAERKEAEEPAALYNKSKAEEAADEDVEISEISIMKRLGAKIRREKKADVEIIWFRPFKSELEKKIENGKSVGKSGEDGVIYTDSLAVEIIGTVNDRIDDFARKIILPISASVLIFTGMIVAVAYFFGITPLSDPMDMTDLNWAINPYAYPKLRDYYLIYTIGVVTISVIYIFMIKELMDTEYAIIEILCIIYALNPWNYYLTFKLVYWNLPLYFELIRYTVYPFIITVCSIGVSLYATFYFMLKTARIPEIPGVSKRIEKIRTRITELPVYLYRKFWLYIFPDDFFTAYKLEKMGKRKNIDHFEVEGGDGGIVYRIKHDDNKRRITTTGRADYRSEKIKTKRSIGIKEVIRLAAEESGIPSIGHHFRKTTKDNIDIIPDKEGERDSGKKKKRKTIYGFGGFLRVYAIPLLFRLALLIFPMNPGDSMIMYSSGLPILLGYLPYRDFGISEVFFIGHETHPHPPLFYYFTAICVFLSGYNYTASTYVSKIIFIIMDSATAYFMYRILIKFGSRTKAVYLVMLYGTAGFVVYGPGFVGMWESIAMMFFTGAVYFYLTDRKEIAGLMLGISFMDSIFGVFIWIILLFNELLEKKYRGFIKLVYPFVGLCIVISLPFLILCPSDYIEGWLKIISYGTSMNYMNKIVPNVILFSHGDRYIEINSAITLIMLGIFLIVIPLYPYGLRRLFILRKKKKYDEERVTERGSAETGENKKDTEYKTKRFSRIVIEIAVFTVAAPIIFGSVHFRLFIWCAPFMIMALFSRIGISQRYRYVFRIWLRKFTGIYLLLVFAEAVFWNIVGYGTPPYADYYYYSFIWYTVFVAVDFALTLILAFVNIGRKPGDAVKNLIRIKLYGLIAILSTLTVFGISLGKIPVFGAYIGAALIIPVTVYILIDLIKLLSPKIKNGR